MGRKHFRAFAWGVLGYSLCVILWGYFLRISESGDGCGTDWPLCSGEVVPAGGGFPTWVEFTHRASSGIALVLVVVLAVLAFRRFGRGHPVRLAALASVLFTVTESLFGAVLVVFGWVAEDVSTGRVLIRPFHVTNTFLLMGALGLTAWWTSRGVARITWPGNPQSRRFLAAAAGLLALAATGSWTGLAGTAFPAASIAAGLAQYLDPGHLLIYLRMAHPVVAVLALVLLVRATGMPTGLGAEGVRRPLTRLVWVLGAAQPAVGTLTVLLLHPTGLRLLHLALADFLWLATLFLWSTHLEGGAEEPERETAALGRASRTE
ncbi:MAG: COX15/CtaA family protein [Gammaproteobacteria bacterium]|nr:COX15/CtaA family protein [Gammaproteobacteria bacterium]